jgi:hypothetical protein
MEQKQQRKQQQQCRVARTATKKRANQEQDACWHSPIVKKKAKMTITKVMKENTRARETVQSTDREERCQLLSQWKRQ